MTELNSDSLLQMREEGELLFPVAEFIRLTSETTWQGFLKFDGQQQLDEGEPVVLFPDDFPPGSKVYVYIPKDDIK